MEEYHGMYGHGHKDNNGNLYLDIENLEEILVREKTNKGTYNIGIINDSNEFSPISLLENSSSRQWREFFWDLKHWRYEDINRFVEFNVPLMAYSLC